MLSGNTAYWGIYNLGPCCRISWQSFYHRNENRDIVALLFNGRAGPREPRVFVCTGKLLDSDRDSFQAFHVVLYDFPRGVRRVQRRMENMNLALLVLLEGKGIINMGEWELHPFHSGEQALSLFFSILHLHSNKKNVSTDF